MARLALAHAALAVCSLASSGWEELSNPSLYAHLVAAVDDECMWSLQKDVALSLEFEGGRESLVVRPHTPRASAASFERRARLCEHSSSMTRMSMRGRVAPALLTVSGDAWYALSWFPLVANRVAYAHRFALRHFAWFGGLPEELKALGAPCSGSKYGQEQTLRGGEVSVHYAKVLSALAVLRRADTSGLLYIDMDAYIDPVAFLAGAPDAYTALSRYFGSSTSLVFADGADRLWRVKSDIFFLRNDDFGARFMTLWLSHRCGYKDQYPLWHLILTEAQRAGCLEKPYTDEIYQSSYWNAHDLDWALNKSRCEADRFAFDAGHSRPIATLRDERTDSHNCSKATIHMYFSYSYKHSAHPCEYGFAVHLGDNRHYLNMTYTPSDDSPGSPARTFKTRTSQLFESFASVAAVFRALALDVKDTTARLAPAEFAAGCCAGTAAGEAPLCDHWTDCAAPQSRY